MVVIGCSPSDDLLAMETLGPMVAGFRAMRREPFSREPCPYDDCKKRDTCRADGSLTGGAQQLTHRMRHAGLLLRQRGVCKTGAEPLFLPLDRATV